MTKRELVIRISSATGITQLNVYAIIQKTLDVIIESLQKGETVELRNFGVFKVITRKKREGINPNLPSQKITIPARRTVVFKQGKKMKKSIR